MQTYTKPFLWVLMSLLLAVPYLSIGHSYSKMLDGHRLTITNIEVLKKNDKSAQIYIDLINTGRFDIETGKDKRLPYLIIDFDQTLSNNELEAFRESIEEKVKSKSLKIRAGEEKLHIFMKVRASKNYIPINSKPSISHSSKKSVNAEAEEPLASLNKVVPLASKAKKEKAVEKKEQKALPKVTKKKEAKRKSSKKNDKEEIVFESPKFESKSLDEVIKEKTKCPDLVIKNMELVKTKNKKATIRFEVENIGKGPALIYTKGDKEDQPLGVRAYVSGAEKISKGAINIGGFFLEGGLDETDGMLLPNNKFEMEVELDIRKKTRYMPMIILSLDAFLKLQECDRTNNSQHIIVE